MSNSPQPAETVPDGRRPAVVPLPPGIQSTRTTGGRLRRVSFGSTAAVVTSIGLVVGFASATASRAAIVGGLLIVGIADNLSDSLSVHLYQESEGLEPHEAILSTVTNFLARLAVTATFVAIVLLVPQGWLAVSTVIWGAFLLGLLTRALARSRGLPIMRELVRHLAIAAIVIVVSRLIGEAIGGGFGSATK